MSMAILKSPTLIHQRLNLSEGRRDSHAIDAPQDDVRASIEGQVRAELEAQYRAQLDAAKEDAKAEGYKEGLAAGHQDGMASALESFKKKQTLLEDVLAKAEDQMEAWAQSVMTEATDMAKAALCHFIGEQAVNPVVLQNVIKKVSASLRESDVLTVRIHPAECQVLRHALKQATPQSGTRLADKLLEDASLQAGGVIIDTPRGEYKATLDVQLKRLFELLDEQRASLNPNAAIYHALRA